MSKHEKDYAAVVRKTIEGCNILMSQNHRS